VTWIVKCPDCATSVEADVLPDERVRHTHLTANGHTHSTGWWVEVVPREFA
jgi:hypothetical protein